MSEAKINQSAILSDLQIKEAISNKDIFISPYNESYLNNTSYDVTLGEHYYSSSPSISESNILDPLDAESITKYWGELKKSDKVITIPAGDTILCHTNEFIGGTNTITTEIRAKSSMTRCCLTVSASGGIGDIGYINRWMMVITNNAKCTVQLTVGKPIAQILFKQSAACSKEYHVKGKYQTTSNVEETMKNWKPEDILPKVKKH